MYNNDLFIDNSLDDPLKDEEFYNYFIKFKNGDIEARDIIIKRNIRLVIYRVMTIFKYVNYEKRDLINIGIIGLIKAVNNYDISKNKKFPAFASPCIDHEIIMFLRKEKRHFNIDSLNRKILNHKGEKEEALENFIKISDDDVFDAIYIKERNLLIREFINQLDERERKTLNLYFGFYNDKMYNQSEISKILNISQAQVSRILKKALTKLKEYLLSVKLVENVYIKQK